MDPLRVGLCGLGTVAQGVNSSPVQRGQALSFSAGGFNLPQGMANTAWAFATAGHPAPELFSALAGEAQGR